MPVSPMTCGAALASVVAGALAGDALGSAQMLDRSALGAYYQSHEDAKPAEANRDERPPDHYPLVTPTGTIPVAALSTRGLYSQARYQAVAYADAYQPVEFTAVDYEPDLGPDVVDSSSLGNSDPEPTPNPVAVSKPKEPLQLASGPTSLEPAGRAKVIDVQAALALN